MHTLFVNRIRLMKSSQYQGPNSVVPPPPRPLTTSESESCERVAGLRIQTGPRSGSKSQMSQNTNKKTQKIEIQEYFRVGAKQTPLNCFYSFPCHMKERGRKREEEKKKHITLFCLFNFRSDVILTCAPDRVGDISVKVQPKREAPISILRFAEDVAKLNFAAGSVACYRCTPSILAPLWSLRIWLVFPYEPGLFKKKKSDGSRQEANFLPYCTVWHAGSYTITKAPIHYEKKTKKKNISAPCVCVCVFFRLTVMQAIYSCYRRATWGEAISANSRGWLAGRY